jgi:hypothetical protein
MNRLGRIVGVWAFREWELYQWKLFEALKLKLFLQSI